MFGHHVAEAAEGCLDEFRVYDMNAGLPPIRVDRYDAVSMLDVMEHLNEPEVLLDELRSALASNPGVEVLISTGNVGSSLRARCFWPGSQLWKTGHLDLPTPLLTFPHRCGAPCCRPVSRSWRRGRSHAFSTAIGDGVIGKMLLAANRLLMGCRAACSPIRSSCGSDTAPTGIASESRHESNRASGPAGLETAARTRREPQLPGALTGRR